MDQLVQCPVCTLFLHNGMSLESHLETHPKDQVIKALCNLSCNNGYPSRTATPMHSERSYRSRSRTPATDDTSKWHGSRGTMDNERFWRRTPSRTPRSTSNISRTGTPHSEVRMSEVNFDTATVSTATQCSAPYSTKSDKTQQTYIQNPLMGDFDQQYLYYQDHQEDREVKYSRSADYTPIDCSNSVFTYNMPQMVPGAKIQTTPAPKRNDFVKILPKPANFLLKTNVGNVAGLQYITTGAKPVQLMVPTTPTFVQKSVQNNMIVTGTIPTSQILDKTVTPTIPSSPLNQITSNTFTPGTTVVTQNSQIIYREMVHNIDGKPFISSMPTVLGSHQDMSNVAQTSSLYQNLMVVDQFGNTSCLYTTPQQLISKPCNAPVFNDNLSTTPIIDKPISNIPNDINKTLIIEVSPMAAAAVSSLCNNAPANIPHVPTSQPSPTKLCKSSKTPTENIDQKNELPSTSKGLKILSNIKVEVPVQHHKNMVNTVLDLTGPNDNEYTERPLSPEKILPDLDDNNHCMSDDCTQPSTSSADSVVSHTFSVIKNIGNPPSYKETTSKSNLTETKIDTDFSDSCPMPDLICNEKPSISPCSELSESCDNSRDRSCLSPKPNSSQSSLNKVETATTKSDNTSSFNYQAKMYNNALRLNNIYVKKNKKILQIKNARTGPVNTATSCTVIDPTPSSSKSTLDNNSINNHINENIDNKIDDTADEFKDNTHNFDADTEELSMDIEPVAPSSINQTQFSTSISMVHIKEEVNTIVEDAISNETSDRGLTPMESLRPINVITYGNMPPGEFDDDSNHRDLLDLETASKTRQFVNMMNENYYSDNVYGEYFAPDRVETFDDRDATLWDEPSQRESEFVLPNFIHESYKIAESSAVDYSEIGVRQGQGQDEDCDGCERDSKADVLSESRSEGEPPLNICADERMPPRGELSGQESNGDMESPWGGMYQEVTPSEPYDLMARESWESDGSDVDPNEKTDNLEKDMIPKTRFHACLQCGVKFSSLKELRNHKAHAHALATSSGATTYSRMVTARTIKKEEKNDIIVSGNFLTIDSKESISTTMLQVYDAIQEAKPKIEGLIKQEPKRRRRDFVCPTCKVDQLTDAAFHAHLKIHPLECLTCGKCFSRRANLALHLKMHLGIKNYKCEVCEKRFLTRQKLSEHHNVHTGRAPVKCTVCDETFRRYSNMAQHRDRHHFQKKAKLRDFVCHCGSVFHSRAKLLWHKETHEEKPKSCLYCSDKFVHAGSLTRHVRRTHNEYYLSDRVKGRVENVPCPVCKQIFLKTNLRSHLQTHSGKRPYHCIICNKNFTTKWNLKLHRWTHMSRSSKPFKCHLCKGAFIRQTEFISHMNAHKSVRPYTCNYCGCQFIRKYNCQRHVREHEMAKKYVCKVPECGKSFHRSYYLSEHMKVHSGARPFSCNICGKTSSNKSNHNKHIKIHHAREVVVTEA